ncbi:3-hydroxyacyl-CoA dehydrogenase [Xylariomycetidae sp. FL2044]|nr:3-hydroxyacyl-CoA dehydrogenase [Xylariomycetidae sp. FL2044]
MKIEGRTFVISGGASGLGRATASDLCLTGGAHVAILDLNADLADSLVASLPRGRARFFACDVQDRASVTAAVSGAADWARESGRPLGGVVPAAGVGGAATILTRTGDPFPLEDFDFVVDINLRGTVDLVRQCVAHMARVEPPAEMEGERGVVVMVASVAAFDGQMGQVAYAASKGAVAAMTLPMARDLARFGIRCVTIAPGIFESGMTGLMPDKLRSGLARVVEFPKRLGRPDEFAVLVRHVIENSMLNGTVVRLDGGLRMPSKI